MNKILSMKKYSFIFKFEVMTALQYIKDILLNMTGYIMHIFIFFNLWNYVYDDPSRLINGYSKSQMIWYIIVTEIIWGATGGRSLCRKICNDVKSGSITYNLNKPYSYIGYVVSSHLGQALVKIITATVFGVVLGIIFCGDFPCKSIIAVIIVLLSMFLATLINTLFVTFIGLFSFIIEDANPFYWLYSKAILVLGTLFPVEFFPGVLQVLIKFSPIYVTCYGPAKLFVDFSSERALKIIVAQLLYLVVAWLMCYMLYRKGVRRLNVNGG